MFSWCWALREHGRAFPNKNVWRRPFWCASMKECFVDSLNAHPSPSCISVQDLLVQGRNPSLATTEEQGWLVFGRSHVSGSIAMGVIFWEHVEMDLFQILFVDINVSHCNSSNHGLAMDGGASDNTRKGSYFGGISCPITRNLFGEMSM